MFGEQWAKKEAPVHWERERASRCRSADDWARTRRRRPKSTHSDAGGLFHLKDATHLPGSACPRTRNKRNACTREGVWFASCLFPAIKKREILYIAFFGCALPLYLRAARNQQFHVLSVPRVCLLATPTSFPYFDARIRWRRSGRSVRPQPSRTRPTLFSPSRAKHRGFE